MRATSQVRRVHPSGLVRSGTATVEGARSRCEPGASTHRDQRVQSGEDGADVVDGGLGAFDVAGAQAAGDEQHVHVWRVVEGVRGQHGLLEGTVVRHGFERLHVVREDGEARVGVVEADEHVERFDRSKYVEDFPLWEQKEAELCWRGCHRMSGCR